MSQADVYKAVKKATVAIVADLSGSLPRQPFTIIGSGVCIHKDGIIATCAHVLNAFASNEELERIRQSKAPINVKAVIPQALFLAGVEGTSVVMHQIAIITAVGSQNVDLALLKLPKNHHAFPDGYPTLPIADYSELHETMDVATCGFPLGDFLGQQLGTITSSFTKGILSSVSPAADVPRESVKAFQLNLTATNGNSGGPVFSPTSGHVFALLQGGIQHPSTGELVHGLVRGEPIYPILNTVERLLQMAEMPVPPAADAEPVSNIELPESQVIEELPELRLRVIPCSENLSLGSPEFQAELRAFSKALNSEHISASSKNFAFDAIGGGGGLSGEYVLMGIAIVQLRKLIETIFKTLSGGTTVELKNGSSTVKCAARDIHKILTAEQIERLLTGPPKPTTRRLPKSTDVIESS
jgi:hypothetical protein